MLLFQLEILEILTFKIKITLHIVTFYTSA